MVYYAAVVVSAVLMWAAFPPLDIGVLAFVAPVPFLWAIRRVERVGDVILMGFLWGFAFYGGMLYWIFIAGGRCLVPAHPGSRGVRDRVCGGGVGWYGCGRHGAGG